MWFKVSLAGVVVSAIVYIIIGLAIYSHWGLGRWWPYLSKTVEKEGMHHKTASIIGNAVIALVIAFFLACVFRLAHGANVTTGMFLGFLIWIGFVMPTLLTPVLFGKKTLQMFYLDTAAFLIAYLVMGGVTAHFNI